MLMNVRLIRINKADKNNSGKDKRVSSTNIISATRLVIMVTKNLSYLMIIMITMISSLLLSRNVLAGRILILMTLWA